MIYQVKLFARAKDLAQQETVSIDLPESATVLDLKQALAKEMPQMEALLRRCAVAVNNDFADDNQALSTGDEIAILPPVSGG